MIKMGRLFEENEKGQFVPYEPDQVTSHASYPPADGGSVIHANRVETKETTSQDAFSRLENELEDLHQAIEVLYDRLRNVLREPTPSDVDQSSLERSGVSDIQRALWQQADVTARAKFKLQDIIRRVDI